MSVPEIDQQCRNRNIYIQAVAGIYIFTLKMLLVIDRQIDRYRYRYRYRYIDIDIYVCIYVCMYVYNYLSQKCGYILKLVTFTYITWIVMFPGFINIKISK